MDTEQFIIEFQDHLACRLDTYEQAIYLYLFRHTRLMGKEEGVFGFKSARSRMATGIGEKGKPMSEGTCSIKLQSLESKGCVEVVGTERLGRRIRLKLPHEIPGVIPAHRPEAVQLLEEMDFFTVPENRRRILDREEHRCFYCLRKLTPDNHVIEHVVSRPEGDNSFRNVVAACRQCNDQKKSLNVEDYLRRLYREDKLNPVEFDGRLSNLKALRNGELRPEAPA